MKLVFFETPLFTRLLPDYLDDESYRALQRVLLENPEQPDEKKALKKAIQAELAARRQKR